MTPPTPRRRDRAMAILGLSPAGSSSTSHLNHQRPRSSWSGGLGSMTNLPGTNPASRPADSDTAASASGSSSLKRLWSSIVKGRGAFYGTKEVLRVIKETTEVFPAVKSVAAVLYEILNIIDTVEGNRKEVKKLQARLKVLEEILKSCPPSGVEQSLEDRLGGLARMLGEKAAYLNGKLKDSKATRAFNAAEDQKEIQQAIEEVRFAIEISMASVSFPLDISISSRRATLEVVKEIAWVKKRVVETRDLVQETKDTLDWLRMNEHLKRIKSITGAEFNQEDRQGCIPGTRIALLASLRRWAKDPSSPSIFWLCGMAGTGKTTLTETFNAQLNAEGLVVASFFCSLDHEERRDVRRILPSLAKSLARVQPKFAKELVKVLESGRVPDDPVAMNLKDQYRILILEPASAAFVPDTLVTLSIDALDECPEDAIKLLLKAVLSQSPPPSLKVFLTSRPEDHLEEHFATHNTHRQLLLHDVEQHIVQADIAIYLRHRLSQISDLEGHVQPEDIETLARRSQNLFIYAATLVKYLEKYRGDRLRLFRELCSSDLAPGSRLDSLYLLYGAVMSEAFKELEPPDVETVQRCLALLIVAPNPLSVTAYAGFLGLDQRAVRSAFARLHSVVRVPRNNDQPIAILHASFADYLTTDNAHRRCEWAIDKASANEAAALRCFAVMNKELRIGISGATTSYKSNDEQPEPLAIPSHVAYACMSWVNHVLGVAAATGSLMDKLWELMDEFLATKSLYWLEVLSVVKRVDYAYNILPTISTGVPTLPSNIHERLKAIIEFASTFRIPISESAPHLYLSALPAHLATQSSMWFQRQIPTIPSLSYSNQGAKSWKSSVSGSVESVAFSPDGRLLASGCRDNTIHLWNPKTGEAVGEPLLGHTDAVMSVAFSPDGTLLASGSYDQTIHLWNTQTGEPLGEPLQQHSSAVHSVAFSPDGSLLASGSGGILVASELDDNTIRLWNPRTREVLGKPLHGRNGAVTSIAFSPDGSLLASGYIENTIRLWNSQTREAVGKPLEGHTAYISGVAFSPDGNILASGSGDYTIRLWDPHTGEALGQPLKRHHRDVWCVAFSLDGSLLASGSNDNTICLWNPQTGEPIGEPLQGHSRGINCVSFSPDGSLLASGSHDHTIRLWNIAHYKTTRLLHRFDPSPLQDRVFFEMYPPSIDINMKDGWIRNGAGNLLFWALPRDRRNLISPVTRWKSGDYCKLDLTQAVHGTEWTKCQDPRPAGASPQLWPLE